MDFKFVSYGLFSKKQNILLQHMHKEVWILTNTCGNNLNTKTRLKSHGYRPEGRFRSMTNVFGPFQLCFQPVLNIRYHYTYYEIFGRTTKLPSPYKVRRSTKFRYFVCNRIEPLHERHENSVEMNSRATP